MLLEFSPLKNRSNNLIYRTLLRMSSESLSRHFAGATGEKGYGAVTIPGNLGSRESSPSDLPQRGDTKSRGKRKLAITLGYIGTRYHGLQKPRTRVRNSESTTHDATGDAASVPTRVLPTIEGELERALHSLGCIATANLGDLDRLGWSRMARTDKGVHAVKTVVSGKLLVDIADIEEGSSSETFPDKDRDSGSESRSNSSSKNNKSTKVPGGEWRCSELAQALDAQLPEDIRCWGVARMPKSFKARDATSWREYEYVFPASMLDVGNDQEARDRGIRGDQRNRSRSETIAALQRALAIFEGVHSFHNFTRSVAFKNKKRNQKRGDRNKRKLGDAGLEEEDDDIDVNEESDVDGWSEGSDVEECRHKNQLKPQEGRKLEPSSSSPPIELVRYEASRLPQALRTITRCELLMEDNEHVTNREEGLQPSVVEVAAERAPESSASQSENGGEDSLGRGRGETGGPFRGESEQFLRIRVRGASFLLNQIRLMLGAAFAVARGDAPEWLLRAALSKEPIVAISNLPLAPPDGLILVDAAFDRYSGRQMSFHRRPQSPFSSEMIFSASDEGTRVGKVKGENVKGACGSTSDVLWLMNEGAADACNAWTWNALYPHVANRWGETGAADRWRSVVLPRFVDRLHGSVANDGGELANEPPSIVIFDDSLSSSSSSSPSFSLTSSPSETPVLAGLEKRWREIERQQTEQLAKKLLRENSRRIGFLQKAIQLEMEQKERHEKRRLKRLHYSTQQQLQPQHLNERGDGGAKEIGMEGVPPSMNSSADISGAEVVSEDRMVAPTENDDRVSVKVLEPQRRRIFPHALLNASAVLPQRFASALACRFRTAPGSDVTAVQRRLADEIYSGRLAPDVSESELLEYVEANFLRNKGVKIPLPASVLKK